jgi:hypothetical protein
MIDDLIIEPDGLVQSIQSQMDVIHNLVKTKPRKSDDPVKILNDILDQLIYQNEPRAPISGRMVIDSTGRRKSFIVPIGYSDPELLQLVRNIDNNQVTMTGSAVQFSATSRVYKRIVIISHGDNFGDPCVGKSDVTILTGHQLSSLRDTVLYNVDISTLYGIGTSGDKICWIGEYQ